MLIRLQLIKFALLKMSVGSISALLLENRNKDMMIICNLRKEKFCSLAVYTVSMRAVEHVDERKRRSLERLFNAAHSDLMSSLHA